MEHSIERDCTSKCRSSVHAKQILSCVVSSTPAQLRTYSVWLCHNFAVNSDEFGRNLLHVASTCGKSEVVEWLIKQCKVELDIKDLESGWTALHRSFFYGQLASARILCTNGANLKLTDREGFTPLDIIMKDRLPYIEYLNTDPCDVFVWGSNFNYNLGIGNSQSRNVPEISEVFRKDFIDIKQVEICKFHSVFLSMSGKVYTCGYGHGGRLGQDAEDISLVPSPVKGLGLQTCTQVAAGQDHLLFLLENGQLWSCGLNTYHQLGHVPPPERLLAPKPVSTKFLKGKKILGIFAARFHSVIYTKDSIYTCGLNAGQLGHPKGERTQVSPRQVSTLYTEECYLTHVASSDGAIVCATSRGDIYVLHEYQIRKIASRQLEILKLSVVGGHLDSRCDVAGVREGGGLELRVALLTKSGKLYLWRQTDPYLRRCLFTTQKELIISDIHINHFSIGLITSVNEGYIGSIIPFKGKRAPPPTVQHMPTVNAKASTGLTVLLNTDDCHFIKVKKLPNIYRGTAITSDSKGRNFAVLQSNPKMGLVEIPMISESKMQQDFSRLFAETHKHDDFHDVIIKVEKREFAAHQYILASRSDYFKKQFAKENFKNGILSIESIKSEAFEQAFKFIYTNYCDFLTEGYEVKWGLPKETGKKNKSSVNLSKPINILQEVSKRLNLNYLAKRLDGIKLINGKISVQNKDPMPYLSFNRNYLSSLCDVNLISSDGVVFPCHKCILISRLDYFHSMLSTCWAENSLLENLSLPISSQVMEVLLDFLYSDDSIIVEKSEDVEFLCHVLMVADQLLMPRLKEICEVSIVKLINLKNAAELLELASVYNSVQLKRTCMQFICINLAAIVESKILEVLSEDVLEELTTYYKNSIPSMHSRKMYSFKDMNEELEFLEKQYPISDAYSFEKHKSDETKSKGRKRCTSLRSDAKDIIKNDIQVESPEKSIVLDVVIPKVLGTEEDIVITLPKEKVKVLKTPIDTTPKKPSQWVMKCLAKEEQAVNLNNIMMEELKLKPLQKKASVSDRKPIPHLSQKQKKLMEATKQQSAEVAIPSSSPDKNVCPWAKLPEQSPPSPSFWEAVAKKDLQPSFLSRDISVPVKDTTFERTSPVIGSPSDIVISLHEIQKAEEQKLRKAANPKIKPLHILNMFCNRPSRPAPGSKYNTCLKNKCNVANSVIRHPSHTHTEYQHCLRQPECPEVVAEVHMCDHGPYIPKSSPYPKSICHPDKPTVIGQQKPPGPENKECSKCSDVFSNLNSPWGQHPPTNSEEDLPEECHNLNEMECNMPMECCCRCCTCRGCPTCATLQNCHPCHFFPLVKNCCTPPQATVGPLCGEHYRG